MGLYSCRSRTVGPNGAGGEGLPALRGEMSRVRWKCGIIVPVRAIRKENGSYG